MAPRNVVKMWKVMMTEKLEKRYMTAKPVAKWNFSQEKNMVEEEKKRG